MTEHCKSALRPRGASRGLSLLLLGAAGAVAGCERPKPTAAWAVDTAAVVGKGRARADSTRVDVYVDATQSMAGFTTVPDSRYVAFLDDLESGVQSAWRRASVRYHKFGTTVRPIERGEFRAAQQRAFYVEPGMSRTTGIDQVVDCRDPGRVAVVVTDLFQSDGDINAIVARIKEECFQRGVSVAVLGLRSQFDGTVYDARVPAYQLRTTADTASHRPFYALLFGEASNLEWLLQTLQDRLGGSAVVIGPRVARGYAVRMAKPPRSQDVNVRQAPGPYQFGFDLRRNAGASSTLLADVHVTPSLGAPPVRPERLELVAYRRKAGAGAAARAADSTETSDLRLTAARLERDTLRLTLALGIADPPGTYAYKLVLRSGARDGFAEPAWVRSFSSPNPSPTADANRTLNLSKFVLDLRRAASTVAQPALAVWHVTVRKL